MLSQIFSEWTSAGYAEFLLAKELEIFSKETQWANVKYNFLQKSLIGDECAGILQALAKIGVLEYREEPDYEYRYRSK